MPEIAPGGDRWAFGTDMVFLRDLCRFWTDGYDWPAAQAALNRWPQFTATIDGNAIHFLHIRGSGRDGRAVLMTHGWPGSVSEFYGVIERIAFPETAGGVAADGVDLVIPSLPGFAFSSKPRAPIGPKRVAALWDRLMRETLGYTRYIAQGGDWGAIVSGLLGLDHGVDTGGGCEAIHLNMYGVRPIAEPRTDEERTWAARIASFRSHEGAYASLQSTKPQTLSYAMMDSPVGIAAWIIEKFHTWCDWHGADSTEGKQAVFSGDQLLTNVMIYLVTRSFNTATWIYRGRADEGGTDLPPGRRIEVPTAVANFPREIIPFAPRRMVEVGYNVVRWTDFLRGGHFAALETGAVFADDVTAFGRDVRRIS